MRLVVIGLALSHPYVFTELAIRQGAAVVGVWDDDPSKAREFAAQWGCQALSHPREAIALRPDGAMITCVAGEHSKYAIPFLEANIPTFVDRPLAISAEELDQLCDAAERTGTPLFSSSSLRYAPDYLAIGQHLRAERLGIPIAASATVSHTIAAYLKPGNTWQDEIGRGGGALFNLGIHGVEPLVTLFGPEVEAVHCFRDRRVFAQSQSEDVAVISLRWRDGRLGTVHLICGSETEGYELILFGSKASLKAQAPSTGVRSWEGGRFGSPHAARDWGYDGLVEAMLLLFRDRQAPVPLAETRAVIRILLAARESATNETSVYL